MKRLIHAAVETPDTSKEVEEIRSILRNLEERLAGLSDEFWTLTPTESYKYVNDTLGYVTRARNKMDKIDISD